MLYYGNLSQEQEHVIDAAFDDSHIPRSSLEPSIFSRPGNGTGGAGAVPPVVLQLDRDNKVLQMADAFLAHYENVRFLNLLSANPERLGHANVMMMPQIPGQQSSHLMRSPSPVCHSTALRAQSSAGQESDLNIIVENGDSSGNPSLSYLSNAFPAHFNVNSPAESDAGSVISSSVMSNRSDGKLFSKPDSFSDSGIPLTSNEQLLLSDAKLRNAMQQPSSWLVSERDVPQKLLPMPFSVPAIPPEWDPSSCASSSQAGSYGSSPLRGSEEWAPPRFQIIWTLQPQKPVTQVAERQRFRCAGCGHLVDKRFLRSLRYCHYYGRYFCTQCHTGRKAVLPATVIHNWDFSAYEVSEQAADLLTGIANEPYFFVVQINAALFKKHRSLRDAQKFRLQLAYLSAYIKQCREAQREQQIIGNADNCPAHWCEQANPSIYSISDLIGVRNKTLLNRWRDLVASLKKHVMSCQACMGRGYVCEGCWRRNDIIFPFNVDAVVVCPVCRFCFHRQCHPHPENPERCPRCCRLEQRRLQKEKQEQQDRSSLSPSSFPESIGDRLPSPPGKNGVHLQIESTAQRLPPLT